MHDPDDDRLVLTADRHEAPTRLVLSSFRLIEDQQLAEYLVQVQGERIEATVPVVDLSNGLASFLGGLARDLRGWSGVRSWHSLERQLSIAATWGDGGHVTLELALDPGFSSTWELTVRVMVEAGEELRRLAADVARLTQPG